MKILAFTPAWGQYAKDFLKYVKPTYAKDFERLRKEGFEIEEIEIGFELDTVHTKYMITNLRQIVLKSIKENAMVFMAAPDIIFGENTIYNMVKLAENKPGMSIAIPHLRIDKGSFTNFCDKRIENGMPIGCYTNKELVNFCFQFPHPTVTNAFDNFDINCTNTGVSIRKIDDKTYSLIHNLPTIHLCQFNEWDMYFWNTMRCVGQWDREYLNQLYLTDRVRMIGSSNIGFAVEMTDNEKNIAPLVKGLKNNDRFKGTIDTPEAEHHVGFRKLIFSLIR